MSSAELAYLDTSAFIKLIVPEPESPALEGELSGWPYVIASELLEVEARRFANRYGDGTAAVEGGLRHVTLIPLTAEIRALAATVNPPDLRTLDAIHLATALSLRGRLGPVLTYDLRLGAASEAAGLAVLAPA